MQLTRGYFLLGPSMAIVFGLMFVPNATLAESQQDTQHANSAATPSGAAPEIIFAPYTGSRENPHVPVTAGPNGWIGGDRDGAARENNSIDSTATGTAGSSANRLYQLY